MALIFSTGFVAQPGPARPFVAVRTRMTTEKEARLVWLRLSQEDEPE